MNKILIILTAIFLTVSCSKKSSERRVPETFITIRIHGCEYIIMNSHSVYKGYGYMAHKGNCDNH
jgi:hypothetical protein